MISYRTVATSCTNCGHEIDRATSTHKLGRKPHAGDISICFYCGHIMIYRNTRGHIRNLTDAEMIDIAGDPQLVKINNLRARLKEKFEAQITKEN